MDLLQSVLQWSGESWKHSLIWDKRTLKAIQLQLPATGRVTFHYPRRTEQLGWVQDRFPLLALGAEQHPQSKNGVVVTENSLNV